MPPLAPADHAPIAAVPEATRPCAAAATAYSGAGAQEATTGAAATIPHCGSAAEATMRSDSGRGAGADDVRPATHAMLRQRHRAYEGWRHPCSRHHSTDSSARSGLVT